MGPIEVGAFLKYFGHRSPCARPAQNQALNALVFLYNSLNKGFRGEKRSTRKSSEEITRSVIGHRSSKAFRLFKSNQLLMAQLLYGTGMRLMDIQLRVKDVDFDRGVISWSETAKG